VPLKLSTFASWQAQSKLKDVEAAMERHFQAHAGQAGDGLELLPGVKRLLEVLQVGLE